MLKRKELDRMLLTMLRSHKGTSDLNFTPGKPLQVEDSGTLVKVDYKPPIEELTPFQTEMLALGVVGNANRDNIGSLVKQGHVDCAYELPGECRFRVNVFQQRQQYSLVLRKLESKIMTMEELGMPAIFKDMAQEKNGLILVTGSTGSGKSTTLAALLNEMNETRAIHILTIEDPIEYVHPHKMATFNQRELGSDFDTFHSSLKAALRQAPKVILVGEIRDRETLEMALSAASTGHLVLSTLHSIDCGQTINRMVGMFEKEEEEQIRARIQECLRFVVSQRLLPKKGGGRVPSQEIMGVNLRVKEILIAGETEGKTFYEIIGVSRNRGWQTHDQCIADLYQAEKITEETAMAYASNKPVLMRILDRIKQERGEEDKDALQLSLDSSVGEAKDLLKKAWPDAITNFPVQIPYGMKGSLVIYEPTLAFKGQTIELNFPLKVQGLIEGIRIESPRGNFNGEGKAQGGLSHPIIKVVNWKIAECHIVDWPLAPKMGLDIIRTVTEELPPDIQLPNPNFTDAKKEALARLSEIGKLQHCEKLRNIKARATDKKEIQAIDETIKTIEDRAQ